MRYDNLRAFAKHIQSASPDHLMAVYLLVSKNNRDLTEASQSIIKSIFPDKHSEMEVKTFQSEGLQVSELLNELNTLSVFVKNRIVVLHHADKLNKAASTALEKYFEKPNPAVKLIVTAQAVNRGTKFYKKAKVQGVILDMPEEKAWQKEKSCQSWVRERVFQDGRQIEPQAIAALVKQIGTDQDVLEQEVFKLYCYLGDRTTITLQDVSAICSFVSTESIWKLGEDIFHFNPGGAVKSIKSLLADGAPLLGLLRQLRSQFQTSFQICTILANGQGRDEIVKHFRYLTGNILNKKIQEAQGYGLERFKRGILVIDETELKAKSSGGDPDFLAEMLVVRLASK